jgi:hypothetical protein
MYKQGAYVLHSLPKAIVTNIPSFFFFLRIFKPVDAFMDKTTQDLHQDEIRDSGISLDSDSSLISQEPAVEIKGREGGWQEWEYIEKGSWIVVVWVSVGE